MDYLYLGSIFRGPLTWVTIGYYPTRRSGRATRYSASSTSTASGSRWCSTRSRRVCPRPPGVVKRPKRSLAFSHTKPILYEAFGWARGALNRPKRRFSARAVGWRPRRPWRHAGRTTCSSTTRVAAKPRAGPARADCSRPQRARACPELRAPRVHGGAGVGAPPSSRARSRQRGRTSARTRAALQHGDAECIY